MKPGLDPEVWASIQSLNLAPPVQQAAPALDPDILKIANLTVGQVENRRKYLRDQYAWGLVAPLSGTRHVYAKRALKDVTDPTERQWLIEEVARISDMIRQQEGKEYRDSGYLSRVGKNLQKVGGSFAEAGTGMVEAGTKLAKSLVGKGSSAEDVKFLRALDAAKESQNPYIPEGSNLAMKAATGAAGMAPDLAGGLLAGAAGGPQAMAGYWTARLQPERREDYLEMGASPGKAAVAGTVSAAAEGAVELMMKDPTGLTKAAAAPVKGALRRGLTKAAGAVGGEGAKRLAKHPLTRRGAAEAVHYVKRAAVETFEEGVQGAVEEGGKYLIAKTDAGIEDRAAGDIYTSAVEQMKAAAPGIAVMGGVGGLAKTLHSAQRFRRLTTGARQERIQREIAEAAEKGETPSRSQWKAWGLPEAEGMSKQQRKEAMKQLAQGLRNIEIARAAVTGVTPTNEQWNKLGLPESEGKTEEQRREYLRKRFTPQPATETKPTTASQQPAAGVAQPEPMQAIPPETTEQRAAGQLSLASQPTATQEARASTTPAQHDFPVDLPGTGEAIGGREVVRQIEQIWGVPVRVGWVGSSRPRGIYKLRPQVSRLGKGEEGSIAVAVHEAIGHHLDNTTSILKGAPIAVRQEVAKLDYDTTANRESEGFAEFLRAYLTGGAERFKGGIDLKVETPNFLAYFENWLNQNPEVKAKIEASRAPVQAFIRAGAVGRVKGQISKTGVDETPIPLRERLDRLLGFLYWRIKEEGMPVRKFTEKALKQGYKPGTDTTPFEDYNALRQVGPHFAAVSVEDGVFALTGNMQKIGPSLRDVLQEIGEGEDYEDFLAWAYARHALESWDQGKNPGITREDAQETLNRLHDPRYERSADRLTEFNNALIEVLADAGVISRTDAQRIAAAYKNYIPLERAKEGTTLRGGRRMVDLSKAVKGRSGSGLQILDPLESTLARAVRFYTRAAQQIVVNKLVQVSESISGLGEWMERVPEKVVAEQFSLGAIKRQLAAAIEDQLGVDADPILDSLDPFTALTVFRPDKTKVHDAPIVRVSIQGNDLYYQLHPDLAEALGGLEAVQDSGIVTQVARAFTGMLKLGATRLNPDFILSNAIRDFQTFVIQGEKGLKGAFDPAKYAAAYVLSELKLAAGMAGDPVVSLFRRMGGELSTYIGLDRNSLRKGVKRTLRGGQGKIETAINIAGVTEIGPRIAEFSAILEREGWLERVRAGQTPPMPVLVKAINAAHDVTVDFRRMGAWGRYLNYYIPFINASLEGVDKTIRTFREHPSRTAIRLGTSLVSLALVYWWSRHDDDDYRERPEWQDGYFILTDTEGNPVVRIPKTHGWGALVSGIERMLDAMYEKDPEPVRRWFRQVATTINPSTYPSGATPLFETVFNYDSFRNRPIVSEAIAKRRAPDQHYDYTTHVAKGVAQFMDKISGGVVALSPAKIDHLANGLTGGLYGKINSPLDKLASGAPWSVNDIPGLKGVTLRRGYAKSVDDFYAEKERLSKADESAKLNKKQLPDEEVIGLRRLVYAEALMGDMRDAARDLPAAEQTQTALAIAGLARKALGRQALERYPNPIADPESVPRDVQVVIKQHIAQKAVAATNRGESAVTAGTYLRDMGASLRATRILGYRRLRSQGIKEDTAAARIGRLRAFLP